MSRPRPPERHCPQRLVTLSRWLSGSSIQRGQRSWRCLNYHGAHELVGARLLFARNGITIATQPIRHRCCFTLGIRPGSGDSITVRGTINQPGFAANFQIYGLPSLTSINMTGCPFVGTIYAPEANFTGGGGGNNLHNWSGAMVVNIVTLNGHCAFHYDESLTNSGIGY